MLSDETVAIIGAGNIGRSIIGGMIRGELVAPDQVIATRRTASALEALEDEHPGLHTTTDNVAAVREASIVVLTIKPQSKAEVITEIRDHVARDVLIVSVLAGVTTERLQLAMGQDQPVVRAMPNTPLRVGRGLTALCPSAQATEADLALARGLFESAGETIDLPEDLFDAFTALAGSGPAYLFYLAQAMQEAGVKMGFEDEQARAIVSQTLLGAATLFSELGEDAAHLRANVTSKAGTTDAATSHLDESGVLEAIRAAVVAARDRGRELAKG